MHIMKAVIQRVSEARVVVDGAKVGSINKGLLILVGIEDADNQQDVEWLAHKIVNMRIFNDDAGLMNLSVLDTAGELLVISQFTLHAATKKGNRPSFIKAAKPLVALPLYEAFKSELQTLLNKPIACGIFGADMKVSLVNDGPVTIVIDSKNME
jgi:D-aminoacyl-tRNA deacylase